MAEDNNSVASLRAKLNQDALFKPMGGMPPIVPSSKKNEILVGEQHLSLSRATVPKGRRPPAKAKKLISKGNQSIVMAQRSPKKSESIDNGEKNEKLILDTGSTENTAEYDEEIGDLDKAVHVVVEEQWLEALNHARKRSDTRFLGHVDEIEQRREEKLSSVAPRSSLPRRSIVVMDSKDTELLHRDLSNKMHEAQRSQMESLQASIQQTPMNAASRRRSQQNMLGAMSSAMQNLDPKALGKKNMLSSMDLRTLRVALRQTWRRLQHIQGSLASAVNHADATLSEYERLQTTLPDVLEKELQRQNQSEEGVVEAEVVPMDVQKRRRKSVAATRTMLGQAITDFIHTLKEAPDTKFVSESMELLFTSFHVEGTSHRPLPSHQAQRVLEALVEVGERLKKADTKGLIVQALLRIIPILRDPDEAIELELWNAGAVDIEEEKPMGKEESLWRAALELLAGSNQTLACFKGGDFIGRLKSMGQLIADAEANRKEAAKLASRMHQRMGGGKKQQLELEMSRIIEKAVSECETIRTVHGAADALATATKNRLISADSPLATPKAIAELMSKSAPSLAACCGVDKSKAKKTLNGFGEKMMKVLAERIKFAEELVLFAATASKHAEEAAREITRINKVGKQCINAEVEFENWRNGTGGLAEIAANNNNMLEAILERRKKTGENVLGASDMMVENVNPIFRRKSVGSTLLSTRASETEGDRLIGSMNHRVETSSQVNRRNSLMVAQLLFLRDRKGALERRDAQEEERRRASLVKEGMEDEDDFEQGRHLMSNVTVRKKKPSAMEALMAENSDEDMESDHEAEEDEEEEEVVDYDESDIESDDDFSMGDLYASASEEEEEELEVQFGNPNFNPMLDKPEKSEVKISLESVKQSLRLPKRLRFKDMSSAMRRRLGSALMDGGGHFLFGGSKRTALRTETPIDVLRNSGKEKRNLMGTRRVCGAEWIASPPASGLRAGSVGRFSVSVSRVTSSMARPEQFA